MKSKVRRKGDDGYRKPKKGGRAAPKRDPKGLEICEQGTVLLCLPKDAWASSKKNILYKVSMQEMLERRKVLLLTTFALGRKREGCI